MWPARKESRQRTHSLQTAVMPYASMALLRTHMATSHVMPMPRADSCISCVTRAHAMSDIRASD